MVVAVLLALTVAAVISLWEADFIFFSRKRHDEMIRAHIESGFTIYAEYPDEVISRLDADSTLLLYDSLPGSRVTISRRPLGLYELVTISSRDNRMRVSKLFGQRPPVSDNYVLYYPDRGTPVSLTGKTHLKGRVRMPAVGVVYGEMGADFFSGEEISPAMMVASDEELPEPNAEAIAAVKELMPLAGGDLTIEGLQHLSDTVIVARRVRIEKGFTGSVQVFALDSIIVGAGVTLEYPSGLFSEKHVSIGDRSTVNGYVIVAPPESSDEPDIMRANYKQSRLARVRGFVYVDGIAQIQGIVSGVAFVDRAIYYSPRGYYENMLYDLTILENREMAWPLWLDGEPQRKEMKWVN
jgi:hypothetical protein